MTVQDGDLLTRRNVIKLGVASLSLTGIAAGTQAHKGVDTITTPFSVPQTLMRAVMQNFRYVATSHLLHR